mmetsp:Transcript_38856/g.109953  ORF Transcript_38856/g.109953 Transcript_38856/m.109953 type:complete len:297 (+) Transcript_38856:367-1257(+)
MCLRDRSGNINCISSTTDNNPEPGTQPQPDYSDPSPGGGDPPDQSLVEVQGCKILLPASYQRGQDPEQYARAILDSLIRSSGCSFLAPNLLRVSFHDAGTFSANSQGFRNNGANGSIRLEEGEPANQSGLIPRTLRLLSDLQQVLSSLNLDLSYADLVQLGAAQAVEAAGGPRYSIRLGRLDASRPDTYDTLPRPNDDIRQLMSGFMAMGLSVRDFVALSGAHTIGRFTQSSPSVFDNLHFRDIMEGGAVLPTDQALMDDPRTASWVGWFADMPGDFFSAFADAMIKMGEMNARWR